MKRIFLITILIFAGLASYAQSQFPSANVRPVTNEQEKITKLFWLATTDTSDYSASDYPGAIMYQTSDSAIYVADGAKWKQVGAAPDLSNYFTKDGTRSEISDSLLLSVLKTDSGLVYVTPHNLDSVAAMKQDTGYAPTLQKVTDNDSTTTHNLYINGVTVGTGGGNSIFNSAFGFQTLFSNTGTSNVAVGYTALHNNTFGGRNMALGTSSLYYNTSGSSNIAIGYKAGMTTLSGSPNNSYNSLFIGSVTSPSATGNSNEIVIGDSTNGNGTNTITLGNGKIAKTFLRGRLADSSYSNSNLDSILQIGPNHELTQTPFAVAISKSDILDSINVNGLTPGRLYKITDATSESIPIYILATSANELDTAHIVVPGYQYTSAEYLFSSDIIELTDRCFGVLRCTSGTWGWVSDPGHDKYNLDSVYVDANGYLHVDFTKQDYYTSVGDIIAVIDNNYPFFQVQCGTSVGVNTTIIGFYRSFYITDSIYYNGASFLNSNTPLTQTTTDSIKWNNTESALDFYQHDTIPGDAAMSYSFPKTYPMITELDGGYTAKLYSSSKSGFSVRFYDDSGTLIATPDSNCKFVYQRLAPNREIVGSAQFNSYLSQAVTNVWLQGWMHKTIQ